MHEPEAKDLDEIIRLIDEAMAMADSLDLKLIGIRLSEARDAALRLAGRD